MEGKKQHNQKQDMTVRKKKFSALRSVRLSR